MTQTTPVLIVGGGPTGLTLSALLSEFGIRSLLVEADPSTCDHPQAHVINRRTAEVFRMLGIEAAMHERADTSTLGGVWFMPSLSEPTLAFFNPVPIDNPAEMARRASFSPSLSTSCPQDIIEPILLDRARAGIGELRFSARLSAVQHNGNDIHAIVAQNGVSQTVNCQWLVGCDGAASTTRALADIAMEGPTLAHIVGIHFQADLSFCTDQRPGVLYWIVNEDCPGTIINMGHQRWVAHVGFDGNRAALEDFDGPRCQAIVDRLAGARVSAKILSVRPWTMTAQVATRYRQGRVVIAGDAAHRFPPTGGFGLNTGVQDAHNLAWKLAGVLSGWARESLIDTYETERRQVAAENCEFSLRNAIGIGSVTGAGAREQARRLASGAVTFDALAAEIQTLLDAEAGHFDPPGRDLGFCYAAGAVVGDGSKAPGVADPDRDYVPSARPGARAPHTWLTRNGERSSTLDLFSTCFTLLCGTTQAAAWRAACTTDAVPLQCVVVGEDVADVDGTWAPLYGVEPGGAVLVRPDGHVGWRSATPVTDPADTLLRVLQRLTTG